MLNLISSIVSIIDKLMPSAKKKKDQKLLEENKRLEKAIKNGDVEEIERIRQRKRNYKNLLGLILILIMVGCKTTMPILGDNIPVKLKIGSDYVREDGVIEQVKVNKNTLVSDAYVYSSVTVLDEKKK